jgi:hypothetical protein
VAKPIYRKPSLARQQGKNTRRRSARKGFSLHACQQYRLTFSNYRRVRQGLRKAIELQTVFFSLQRVPGCALAQKIFFVRRVLRSVAGKFKAPSALCG